MPLNTAKIKEAISQRYGIKESSIKRTSKNKVSTGIVRTFSSDVYIHIVVMSDLSDEEIISITYSLRPDVEGNPCVILNPERFVFCYLKGDKKEGMPDSFTIFLKSYWDENQCVDDQTHEDLYKLQPEGFNELMESQFEYHGPSKEGIAKLRLWGFIESPEVEQFMAEHSEE